MLFKLKNYQTEAAREILWRLDDARDDFHGKGRRSSFALSATTGAGKTVIAATVIESLFRGSSEFDFDPDPTAVVLWVTDDPSLNVQTRERIRDSADRLDVSALVTIGESFPETFEPGHVYFLNIQKLGSKTGYVKRTDKRSYTLWETIRNTIENPAITLYMVLDEAHRGMMPTARTGNGESRATIVQRIVNGRDGIPPVPIVWGISATIERFKKAMEDAQGRYRVPDVLIDPVPLE